MAKKNLDVEAGVADGQKKKRTSSPTKKAVNAFKSMVEVIDGKEDLGENHKAAILDYVQGLRVLTESMEADLSDMESLPEVCRLIMEIGRGGGHTKKLNLF